MDRKEGAVDKVAEYQYNKGERAYMSFQGNMFLQDIDGNMWPVYSTDDASVKEWHALRSYQDAERKKGVPITFKTPLSETYLPWNRRTYGDFWFGEHKGKPLIIAFIPDMPHVYATEIARFTNFRWRAGYPKPVNIRQHDPSKSMLDHFSTRVGEKGGQNE